MKEGLAAVKFNGGVILTDLKSKQYVFIEKDCILVVAQLLVQLYEEGLTGTDSYLKEYKKED